MSDGKKILGESLFWMDRKGRLTLGRQCYAYPDPDDRAALILRNWLLPEAVLRLVPGSAMRAANGRETNTYDLARSVVIDDLIDVPPLPEGSLNDDEGWVVDEQDVAAPPHG